MTTWCSRTLCSITEKMNDDSPGKGEGRHARASSWPLVRAGSQTALAALLLLCQGCATLRVPVKVPVVAPAEMLRTDRSGLTLEVKPIQGVNEYWDLFNDNLPEIGIAAAWVKLSNSGSETLDLSESRWTLKIGERTLARMQTSKVLKEYYKRRHIRMYLVSADAKAQKELDNISFHQGRLRPSGESEGLVFFHIDPSSAPQWARNATLRISGIRPPAGKRFDLRLSLAYATP